FSASSTGTPILARPFLNAASNAQASAIVAFPGVSTGSVLVKDSAHTFYGWNLALRQDILDGPWYRFDGLFGYRYFRFDEGLQIQENAQPLGSAFAAGTNIASTDSFATRNIFNGFDFGLRGDFTYGDWSLGLLGKLAAGYLHRTTDINGSQLVTVPGQAPVL